MPTTMITRRALLGLLAMGGVKALAQSETPNPGAMRVACVGDSITYGAGIKDREHQSYPAQLGRMLGPNWDVRNFGVSGATLLKRGDKPYWQQNALRDALAFRPDVVLLKLGTNDSKPQNWQYRDEFAGDARDLIRQFQQNPAGRARVFVCLPVPAFPGNFGIRDNIIHDEVIPRLREAALLEHAGVIDLYTALSGHGELFPDHVHPTGEGARLMAETIRPFLKG